MGKKFGALVLLWISLFVLIAKANVFALASPPRSGGPLAISMDGMTLVTTNPDSNTISIIAATTATLLAEIPVGIDPRAVAFNAEDTHAITANQGSDTLSVIDIASGTMIREIPVGSRPVNIALSPSGGLFAIAELGSDQVRLMDSIGYETLAVFSVADRPSGLAFTPDGRRLLVSHLLSGTITVIRLDLFNQFFPIISNAGPLETPLDPTGLFENRTPIFISSQFQIQTWPNVAPAPNLIVNSTATHAYLPQTMANGQGLNVQFDTTVFPKVSVIDLVNHIHLTSEHIPLPETDRPVALPWAVALSASGTELWVVNAASNDVSVIDIANPTLPKGIANIPVGDNPRGIVISPDGGTAYVNNTLSGTITVIDTNTFTVAQVITTTEIPLPPLLQNGKKLFNTSASPELSQARWIACSTCHIEGEHDGRTWQLQFIGNPEITSSQVITRNTTSLLGMIQTYPLRWSAEWNESADSEFAIRFEQFGIGLIPGDIHPTLGDPNQGRSYDLDSLAAFIDSLAVPNRTQALSPEALAGQIVFFSPDTGCAGCHPPPYFTDFLPHDVGTANAPSEWFGPMIDTPSLRFLFDSAPYLHDGGAANLMDVLTAANPEDEHGVTSVLSTQEIEDLIAFLLSLPFE